MGVHLDRPEMEDRLHPDPLRRAHREEGLPDRRDQKEDRPQPRRRLHQRFC